MSENQRRWRWGFLDISLRFNCYGEYVEDSPEDERLISQQREIEVTFDTIVQRCQQVFGVLKEANIHEKYNAQGRYVIKGVHCHDNVKYQESGNATDFVFLTMELVIAHDPSTPRPSDSEVLKMLRQVLQGNSGQLNIRAESVDIYEVPNSTQYQLIFVFSDGVVVRICVVPSAEFAI